KSLVLACGTEATEQLRPGSGQPADQQAPPAAGDIDVLALDPVENRLLWLAHVELRSDLGEGLLGNSAELDHDRAVVDLEAVELACRGAAADVLEALDHQRSHAGGRQAGGGEQAAGAGADHDRIELIRHAQPPRRCGTGSPRRPGLW